MLQVPEDCLNTKTAPCLAQIKKMPDQPVRVGLIQVQPADDTIMKWSSFEKEPSVEVIKGKIQFRTVKGSKKEKHAQNESLRINGVLVKNPQVMVQKDGDTLQILSLKDFMILTYNMIAGNEPVLEEKPTEISPQSTRFLDKENLVFYVAPYFKTKSKLLTFLKAIEEPWKKQLQLQSESQANVLKRALASEAEEKSKIDAEKALKEQKLKKVREFFFYRTFYR